MAYKLQPGNYVKFVKGTNEAWKNFTPKDADTLYFIYDKDSTEGSLYLGERLISSSGNASSLEGITDILLSENIAPDSLLMYNAETGKWENQAANEVFLKAIDEMAAASAEADGSSGLVPMPKMGEEGLFLRGDATWADPLEGIDDKIAAATAEAIADMLNEAPENLDSLKEIVEWIQGHEDVADLTAIDGRVKALEEAINGKESITDEETGEVVTPAVQGLLDKVNALDNSLNDEEDGIAKQLEDLLKMLQWNNIVEEEEING